MRVRCCFYESINKLTLIFRLLGFVLFLGIPNLSFASKLTLEVANNRGGAIVIDDANKKCRSACTVNMDDGSAINLFAIPDPGYRFQNWSKDCSGNPAPFCTLTGEQNKQLTAHFVKNPKTGLQAKVLLLLHDEEHKATVWNEFVEKYFSHQCPTIYEGVILDDDYPNQQNNVLCYRIAFDYYRLLQRSLAAKSKSSTVSSIKTTNRQQVNEIHAAILAITARHANSKLTLVSERSVTNSAQIFLRSESASRFNILGLISLQSKENRRTTKSRGSSQNKIPTFHLTATPEQPEKINAALIEMTESWWLAK